jgi:site-specific DNA recombinase
LEIAMTTPVRAALYLRVSTGRQAENDLSIPDQRRQAKAYCASRGWEIVADYVEPGLSATDDRRPEFQRMIDAATTKPPAFDVILVHSFSRFFRDQFQLEFYVRRLAKAGVRLVSITQELGDDPMSNMIRQIMALFDEYQSKENAKHTLRAMKENARQGFWNGALPPIGYRIVEASEQRGHRTKKTLEIDPVQAETVRLIFRLAREGSGSSGPMGVKSIATHLNAIGIRTRDGGRWGVDAVHKVLTRTTYVGRHRFNTKFWKTRERKAETEIVEMAVPAIVDKDEFEVVQMLLKSRSPAMVAPRVVSGPTLLTGICFCAACGGAMTLRTGKSGRYRYYTCCTKARQGETGCPGRTVPMEKLDNRIAEYIEQRLLEPKRLEQLLSHVLDRRTERAERRKSHIAELRKRAAEADAKLKRLYDAIENGVADLSDPMLKDRIAELKATRDQARLDAERAEDAIDRAGPTITPQTLKTFARTARKRMRTESGGYRRDHLRALAQRVEVDQKELRIMGSKSVLLRTLVATSSAKTAGFGVPSSVPKWRAPPGTSSTGRPASRALPVPSGGQAGQFEAERTQSLARARLIGLRIGLNLLHAVEKQPALAGHIVAGGKMEYRLPALLHRRDRRDAAFAHHRGVHIGRGMQRIHGHARSLEFLGQVDREHDLRQLALRIGAVAVIAFGQHHVIEVERVLAERGDIHDTRGRACL